MKQTSVKTVSADENVLEALKRTPQLAEKPLEKCHGYVVVHAALQSVQTSTC